MIIEPKENNSTGVGVYLHNKSDWEVIADVNFEINDCKRKIKEEKFVGKGDGKGFSDMVGSSQMHQRRPID